MYGDEAMIRGTLLITLILLVMVLPSASIVAQTAANYDVDQYFLTVHEDGSVDVYIHVIVSNPPADISIPVIGTPIFYEAHTKGSELPITYDNGVLTVTVYYDNATIHYVTVEATSKTGDLWTLAFNAQWTCTVVLPNNAVIVNIEPADFTPVIINGTLGFMFTPGQINITYILIPIVTTTTTTTTTMTSTTTTTSSAGTTTATSTLTTTTTTTTTSATTTTAATSTSTTVGTSTSQLSTTTTTTGTGFSTHTATQATTQPSQPQQNTMLLIVLGIVAIAIIAGALFMLKGKKSKGNSGPAEIDYSRLDERDKSILKALEEHGELTGRELMEITGIPKTPFYRKLKKLIDMGLIEYRDVEGIRRYRLKR